MKHTYPLRRTLAALLCAGLLTAAASVGAAALEPNGNNVRFRNWVTNDPEYQFSEQYKTSVWYQNFNNLKLTANQRNNILRIAVSQLGYHEGNSAEDFDGMNRAGTENYIEYARLVVPFYNDNHYEWCACFVNWVMSQARIDYAYGEISCSQWVSWLKNNNMFQSSPAYKGSYTPKPADIIFFDWDENGGAADHIGYVMYVSDGTVYTIEGNSSDAVSLKSYDLNARCILGFGVPPYDEGGEATLDFSLSGGAPAGQYVIGKTGAYLYTEADKKSEKLGKTAIGQTVTVTGTENDFAVVTYGNLTGYMKLSDLTLFTPQHTVTFVCDDEVLGTEVFDPGQKSVSLPEIPARAGYTGRWEDYSLTDTDLTLHVLWTPITYHVTYVIDGEELGKTDYTVESIPDLRASAPTVTRGGLCAVWNKFPAIDPAAPADVTVTGTWTGAPDTEAPTDVPTSPVTDDPQTGADDPSDPPVDTAADTTADTAEDTDPAEDSGCASALAAPAALLMMIGGAILRKRKYN